jgi:hypothetical protein
MTLPDTYLAVEDCRSGEIAVVPIGPDEPLDLEAQLDAWIAAEYCGELVRDGELMPRLPGEGYAWLQTDGRPLDSPIVWESGGFYLKEAP